MRSAKKNKDRERSIILIVLILGVILVTRFLPVETALVVLSDGACINKVTNSSGAFYGYTYEYYFGNPRTFKLIVTEGIGCGDSTVKYKVTPDTLSTNIFGLSIVIVLLSVIIFLLHRYILGKSINISRVPFIKVKIRTRIKITTRILLIFLAAILITRFFPLQRSLINEVEDIYISNEKKITYSIHTYEYKLGFPITLKTIVSQNMECDGKTSEYIMNRNTFKHNLYGMSIVITLISLIIGISFGELFNRTEN